MRRGYGKHRVPKTIGFVRDTVITRFLGHLYIDVQNTVLTNRGRMCEGDTPVPVLNRAKERRGSSDIQRGGTNIPDHRGKRWRRRRRPHNAKGPDYEVTCLRVPPRFFDQGEHDLWLIGVPTNVCIARIVWTPVRVTGSDSCFLCLYQSPLARYYDGDGKIGRTANPNPCHHPA